MIFLGYVFIKNDTQNFTFCIKETVLSPTCILSIDTFGNCLLPLNDGELSFVIISFLFIQ